MNMKRCFPKIAPPSERTDGTINHCYGNPGLPGRRFRGPARIDHQQRQPPAGDRDHLLCRTGAGYASRMTTPIRHFPSLFVETEYLRETGALLATRRPRSPSDQPIWAAHLSVAEGGSVGDVQYETDRGKFLTRNRKARNAAAVSEGWPLSNSAGAVLDPIFSLRRQVQIARGQTVTIAFWTMAAVLARRNHRYGGSPSRCRGIRTRHHPGRHPCANPACSILVSAATTRIFSSCLPIIWSISDAGLARGARNS